MKGVAQLVVFWIIVLCVVCDQQQQFYTSFSNYFVKTIPSAYSTFSNLRQFYVTKAQQLVAVGPAGNSWTLYSANLTATTTSMQTICTAALSGQNNAYSVSSYPNSNENTIFVINEKKSGTSFFEQCTTNRDISRPNYNPNFIIPLDVGLVLVDDAALHYLYSSSATSSPRLNLLDREIFITSANYISLIGGTSGRIKLNDTISTEQYLFLLRNSPPSVVIVKSTNSSLILFKVLPIQNYMNNPFTICYIEQSGLLIIGQSDGLKFIVMDTDGNLWYDFALVSPSFASALFYEANGQQFYIWNRYSSLQHQILIFNMTNLNTYISQNPLKVSDSQIQNLNISLSATNILPHNFSITYNYTISQLFSTPISVSHTSSTFNFKDIFYGLHVNSNTKSRITSVLPTNDGVYIAVAFEGSIRIPWQHTPFSTSQSEVGIVVLRVDQLTNWRDSFKWSILLSDHLSFPVSEISQILQCDSNSIVVFATSTQYFFVAKIDASSGTLLHLNYVQNGFREANCEFNSLEMIQIALDKGYTRYNSSANSSTYTVNVNEPTNQQIKFGRIQAVSKSKPPVVPPTPVVTTRNATFTLETANFNGLKLTFGNRYFYGSCVASLCPIAKSSGSYSYLYSDKYGIMLQQQDHIFTSFELVDTSSSIIVGYELLSNVLSRAVIYWIINGQRSDKYYLDSIIGLDTSSSKSSTKALHVLIQQNSIKIIVQIERNGWNHLAIVTFSQLNELQSSSIVLFSNTNYFFKGFFNLFDEYYLFGSFSASAIETVASDLQFFNSNLEQSALLIFSLSSTDLTSCFGVAPYSPNSCNNNGYCSQNGSCTCTNPNYSDSSQCITPYCFDQIQTASNVCNSRGKCATANKCICVNGNQGDSCQISTCVSGGGCGIYGNCTFENLCSCSYSTIGSQCLTPISLSNSLYCNRDYSINWKEQLSIQSLASLDGVVVKSMGVMDLFYFFNNVVYKKTSLFTQLLSNYKIEQMQYISNHQHLLLIGTTTNNKLFLKLIHSITAELIWEMLISNFNLISMDQYNTNSIFLVLTTQQIEDTISILDCTVTSNYVVVGIDFLKRKCFFSSTSMESIDFLLNIASSENIDSLIVVKSNNKLVKYDNLVVTKWINTLSFPISSISFDGYNQLFILSQISNSSYAVHILNTNLQAEQFESIYIIANVSLYCYSLQINTKHYMSLLCETNNATQLVVSSKSFSTFVSSSSIFWILLKSSTITVYQITNPILKSSTVLLANEATFSFVSSTNSRVVQLNTMQELTILPQYLQRLQHDFYNCEPCQSFEASNGTVCVDCLEFPNNLDCIIKFSSNNSAIEIDKLSLASGIVVPVVLVIFCCCVGICVVGVIIGVIVIVRKNKKQQQKQQDVELSLMPFLSQTDTQALNALLSKFTIDERLFEINYQDLTNLKEIGQGAVGTVYYCKYNKIDAAVKIFSCFDVFSTQQDFSAFEREISLLSSLRHSNIVGFIGGCLKVPFVGIVTEFCNGGSLAKFLIENKSTIDWTTKLSILHDVSKGLLYLHEMGIIHRDLKTENILLSETTSGHLTAKISDFGTSKRATSFTNQRMTKYIGTSFYIAPEVVLGEEYNQLADVFSFGILMFEVLLEEANPYSYSTKVNPNQMYIETEVARNASIRPELPKDFEITEQNEWYIELAKECWQHSPTNRPPLTQIQAILQKKYEKTVNKSL